jgi:ribosome-binding factor A
LSQVGFISLTRVELSKDLQNANIFVSILGNEEVAGQVMEALAKGAGFVRTMLGKRMRMRTSPEIHFKLDDSIAHSARIRSLLNDVRGDEPADETDEAAPDDDFDPVDDEAADEAESPDEARDD